MAAAAAAEEEDSEASESEDEASTGDRLRREQDVIGSIQSLWRGKQIRKLTRLQTVRSNNPALPVRSHVQPQHADAVRLIKSCVDLQAATMEQKAKDNDFALGARWVIEPLRSFNRIKDTALLSPPSDHCTVLALFGVGQAARRARVPVGAAPAAALGNGAAAAGGGAAADARPSGVHGLRAARPDPTGRAPVGGGGGEMACSSYTFHWR